MDFDLRQLEIFCAVVEHENFSRAASAVGLAQASVSERVAGLEKDVGATLLDRLGRRVLPTAIGRRLFEHGSQLLQDRKNIYRDLESMLGIDSGEIIVGASTIPGEFILPPLLAGFHRAHPKIVPRVVVSDSKAIIEQVSDGLLEVAVVGARSDSSVLTFDPWCTDELVIACAMKHPWSNRRVVSAEALCEQPFVVREAGSGTRAILEGYLSEHFDLRMEDLNIVAQMGSTTAVIEAVRAGLGVSILSSRALNGAVASKSLHRLKLKGHALPRTFYICHHGQRARSAVATLFVEFLKKNS